MMAQIGKLFAQVSSNGAGDPNDRFEQAMRQMISSEEGPKPFVPETPLEEAQVIMWNAFAEPSRKKRIEGAKRA